MSFQIAVARAAISVPFVFREAVDYFCGSRLDPAAWESSLSTAGSAVPSVIGERVFVVVNGDITTDVHLSTRCVLVVQGDLCATVRAADQCQIVVSGRLDKHGAVRSTGNVDAFVGQDMEGTVMCRGASTIWIEGDMSGIVKTGSPSTTLRIMGSCGGLVSPAGSAAMLNLQVAGFMSFTALETIANYGYVEFSAAVENSDKPAGVYPLRRARSKQGMEFISGICVIRNSVR